ncbi:MULTISPECIES: extracellular solute-binding protein [unclassified Paenibacillus]|uniref:extracellular solute-binding protein n=1 Tax=unclassified Paenibacillus TaxID=185978 RepID=UPI00362B2134
MDKRTAAVFLFILFFLLLSTGCMEFPGSGTRTADIASDKNAIEVPITMMVPYFEEEPPRPNNAIIKAIESYTKSKLQITWIPSAAYDDKVSASIASGVTPEVMVVQKNKSSNLMEAQRSGMFWDIGPYLDDYSNLSKLNPMIMSNISVNGKKFGLYRARDVSPNGMIIRKDWLNNLGLNEPKTLDELLEVLRAFTWNDPDKNGKNDTIGLALNKLQMGEIPGGFDTIVSYFGGPNGWTVTTDGKFIPDFGTKEYLDAMKFFRKLYEEKLVNQDFAIYSKAEDLITKGKAGVFFQAKKATVIESHLQKLFPEAQLQPISRISGPKGERLPASPGYNGLLMFPKTSVQSEERLKYILSVMDRLLDKQMQDLFQWGIEGVHYKVVNGIYIRTDEKAYSQNNALHQLKLSTLDATVGEINLTEKKLIEQKNANKVISVGNPAQSLYSPMMWEKESVLNSIIEDARTKYIIGQLNDAGWEEAIEQWKKNGGDNVISEFEADYVKSKK